MRVVPSLNHVSLRTFNNLLSWVIVVMAVYILIFPLIPQFTFWWNKLTNQHPTLVSVNLSLSDGEDPPKETYPSENTLVIPGINLQEVVYEGAGSWILSKGLWHRPQTSNPSEASNTVIAGHRFTYRGAAVFYHLDKVSAGDQIILYWEGNKYIYEVARTYVVPPTALEVEAPTEEPRLTLYTCTPLWTSQSRLVIESALKEVL